MKVGLKWEKEDQHQLLTISVISARCLFCIFCSWQLIIQRYKIWGLICEYVRNLPSVNQTDNFSDPYVKVRVQQSQIIEKVGCLIYPMHHFVKSLVDMERKSEDIVKVGRH